MTAADSRRAVIAQASRVARLMNAYDPPHVTPEQTAALVEARRELERLREERRGMREAGERVEVGA